MQALALLFVLIPAFALPAVPQINGVFLSESKERVRFGEDTYALKRKVEFKPPDINIEFIYSDFHTAAPLVTQSLRGRLISMQPSHINGRIYDFDLKVLSSSLAVITRTPLSTALGIAGCAAEHKPVDLTKTSCGTFKQQAGTLYYRLLVEDDQRILISNPESVAKERSTMVVAPPLIKSAPQRAKAAPPPIRPATPVVKSKAPAVKSRTH